MFKEGDQVLFWNDEYLLVGVGKALEDQKENEKMNILDEVDGTTFLAEPKDCVHIPSEFAYNILIEAMQSLAGPAKLVGNDF